MSRDFYGENGEYRGREDDCGNFYGASGEYCGPASDGDGGF